MPVSILGGELPPREVDLRDRLGVTKFEVALPRENLRLAFTASTLAG